MLLDRISLFDRRIKNMIKLSGYKISLIAFLVVFVVDLPYYGWATIFSMTFKLDANTSYTLWRFKSSDFTTSELGSVLTYIDIALRDVLVTLLQIALNLASIYLFKKHMANKSRLTESNKSGPSSAEIRATVMCFVMCALSLVEHLIIVVGIL
jgi:hypothetical protein